MAYKTILVCLNEINRLPQLTDAARTLGAKFKTHVTGLYVLPSVQVYPIAGYAAAPDLYDGNRTYFTTNEVKVRSAFEQAMKADGLSFDFHVVDSSVPSIGSEVMRQGRAADLIVVSATDRSNKPGVEYDFVERLVISAGRPVLVLPFIGEAKLNCDEILIGWDDGREASRAVFDALPFLQKSKRTRIVSIDTAGTGTLPGAALAEALDRHGVKAELTNVASDGQATGAALLRAASDFGSGLVVIGAYGHSRFTEFIFGGATRHVVHHLDRPVLMSH